MSTTEVTDMVADDNVDAEALQAQINMSMSFAEDLVSSWIKPEHKANLAKSAVDAHKLLDEQLRRPPRLGVGAPIPESSVTARDAARLKHQLSGTGKKRAPEDGISHKPGNQSEEEEERRGGTVRKKMKHDPFSGRSKTKAKAKLDANSVTQSTHFPITSHRQADDRDSKTGSDGQEHGYGSLSSSLNASKIDKEGSFAMKRWGNHSGKQADMKSQEQRIPQTLLQTSQVVPRSDLPCCDQIRSVSPPPPRGSTMSSVSFSIPGPFSPVVQPEIKRHAESNVLDHCPVPKSAEDLCLTVPLLNLDGPPMRKDGSGKDDNPESPKKRHRRRRKKKHPIKIEGQPLS